MEATKVKRWDRATVGNDHHLQAGKGKGRDNCCNPVTALFSRMRPRQKLQLREKNSATVRLQTEWQETGKKHASFLFCKRLLLTEFKWKPWTSSHLVHRKRQRRMENRSRSANRICSTIHKLAPQYLLQPLFG